MEPLEHGVQVSRAGHGRSRGHLAGEVHDVLGAYRRWNSARSRRRRKRSSPTFSKSAKKFLDVGFPSVQSRVEQLGDVAFTYRAQLQDTLAHEVQPLAGTGHRGELLGPLAGEVAGPAARREARVCVSKRPPAAEIRTRSE